MLLLVVMLFYRDRDGCVGSKEVGLIMKSVGQNPSEAEIQVKERKRVKVGWCGERAIVRERVRGERENKLWIERETVREIVRKY